MSKYLNPITYFLFFKYKILRHKRISYAQSGEDLIIERFLKTLNVSKPFYVDIGANHPTMLNNTYLFYKKGGRGLCVEPNLKLYHKFKYSRPKDTSLNIGIGTKKDILKFYIFKEDVLSTFSEEVAKKYQKMGHELSRISDVQIYPLRDILNVHAKGRAIDLLCIDTEGFDFAVLESNDWDKFRPKLILLETLEYEREGFARKLNAEYDPYLSKIGYKKLADTFINTIYIDTQWAKIIKLNLDHQHE